MFRLEKEYANTHKDLPARAFFSVGARETSAFGEKDMVKDLRTFVAGLQGQRRFQPQVWVAEGETHHSIFPGAAMRGIRFLYAPPTSGKPLRPAK